jgi:trimeric autotransporter adhesin
LAAHEGNVISGNTGTSGSQSRGGIYLYGDSTIVQGNTIGLSADKSTIIANGGVPAGAGSSGGIVIPETNNNTLIGGINAGEGNTIAGNVGSGIAIKNTTGTAGASVTILGNNIYSNTALGIDLKVDGVTLNDAPAALDSDTGPNNLQNFPLLYNAFVSGGGFNLTGELRSAANTTYRLEFFRTPVSATDPTGYGEGKDYLAYLNVTTDATGYASINIINTANIWGIIATDRISATATEIVTSNYRSTSEFSQNIIVTANVAPVNTVPGAQTVNEDTSLAITGISVNDVDGNLATTQLTVNNGTLTVNLAGGATISAGSNGGKTLTLSGTQTQINAAIATLTYQGFANYNGSD